MEDTTLINLWKQQDEKLQKNMQLNLFLLESLQKEKAAARLNSLARFKGWAVFLGIAWIFFLGLLLYGNRFSNPYFSISVSAILVFNIAAVVVYIKHISLIRQLDYSQNIVATQNKLARLQASTFNLRFLVLQAPFYCTWFWSTDMINANPALFWSVSVPIALLFTILAAVLYRNLTLENMHKKWVRALINSTPEHTSVFKAIDFVKQIEEFKKG